MEQWLNIMWKVEGKKMQNYFDTIDLQYFCSSDFENNNNFSAQCTSCSSSHINCATRVQNVFGLIQACVPILQTSVQQCRIHDMLESTEFLMDTHWLFSALQETDLLVTI